MRQQAIECVTLLWSYDKQRSMVLPAFEDAQTPNRFVFPNLCHMVMNFAIHLFAKRPRVQNVNLIIRKFKNTTVSWLIQRRSLPSCCSNETVDVFVWASHFKSATVDLLCLSFLSNWGAIVFFVSALLSNAGLVDFFVSASVLIMERCLFVSDPYPSLYLKDSRFLSLSSFSNN